MFLVSDAHGNRDLFDTIEQARNHAKGLMAGYVDGTRCANDPKPSITELRSIERYFYDKAAKEIARVVLT